MAFDEKLADRIRKVLVRREGVSERKMFGGIAFMIQGNMCCGVIKNDLMLRLGDADAARALEEPFTREMDFTGRPMRSMIYVGHEGHETDADLRRWVRRAVKFAEQLPAK